MMTEKSTARPPLLYPVRTLVTTEWLAPRLGDPRLVVADVRWDMADPKGGRAAYEAGHIPGAVFLDLDTQLADRSDLRRGRHPLPDPLRFVKILAEVGIGKGKSVIAYDGGGGEIAARLWWMLRWIGHDDVAVLDGSLNKWVAEERTLESGPVPPALAVPPLEPLPRLGMVLPKTEVQPAIERGLLLLDARAPERYRGEVEPVDRCAGHIPGAINAPWAENMTPSAPPVFRNPETLRARFKALGVRPGTAVACSCGSGVTACHDILALEIAGFPGARLYPGSWSEWIAN